MGKAHDANPQVCTRFHHAIELIGRRWTGAIVFLLLRSPCRFATLRDSIPDITDRMLSERLQELEREGIVERKVIPETPVRVEYSLTKKGHALGSAIGEMAEWADKWIPLEAGAPAGQHVHERGPAVPSGERQKRGKELGGAFRACLASHNQGRAETVAESREANARRRVSGDQRVARGASAPARATPGTRSPDLVPRQRHWNHSHEDG